MRAGWPGLRRTLCFPSNPSYNGNWDLLRTAMRASGLTIVLAISLWPLATNAYAARYTVIDPPGSVETFVTGIDNNGDIIGSYYEVSGAEHAFVRAPGGTYMVFAYKQKGIDPYAINDRGWIAGTYLDQGVFTGFVRKPNGHIATFTPGA